VFQWLVVHKDEVQALIGIGTALLTAILVVITGIYAWVTFSTLRTIESDLLFRSRPILRFSIHVVEVVVDNSTKRISFKLHLGADHAPVLLRSVTVTFPYIGSEESKEIFMGGKRRQPIPVDGKISYDRSFLTTQNVGTPTTDVRYNDLGENFHFRTRFEDSNYVFTNKTNKRTVGKLIKSAFHWAQETLEDMRHLE
jgi:hypothetical protein